ncbi:uncharacterized protein LOC133815350 [Humulus lupulus]|uniref:uncharacterized protein LOC133815350 n=1 Tax=Humulus lupulus TaxID=3486 RepID=UPI002B413B8F|nr:uncharacterized protein LOC133815350 [Humulus lupulus]
MASQISIAHSVSQPPTTNVPPDPVVPSTPTPSPLTPIQHSTPSSPLPTIPSVNQPISVKLDEHNFVVWQTRMLNIIITNVLEDFINGSRSCPVINGTEPTAPLTQDFQTWQRYNRLVMSWIYASTSEFMLGQIVGYTTAFDTWHALEQIYAAASFSRLSELRTLLQHMKKDGLTTFTYIQKFRGLCNTLAAAGEPVSYTNQLLYFLEGLGRDYNAYVTPIQARADKPTMEEAYSLLLNYDALLNRQNSIDTLSSLQANFANFSPHRSKYKPTLLNQHLVPPLQIPIDPLHFPLIRLDHPLLGPLPSPLIIPHPDLQIKIAPSAKYVSKWAILQMFATIDKT